jgi:salicylate hydroxylase
VSFPSKTTSPGLIRIRYWQIYRPDFQKVLAEGALKAGAKILFGKHVVQMDTEEGYVKLEDGTSLTGDVVICADGKYTRY